MTSVENTAHLYINLIMFALSSAPNSYFSNSSVSTISCKLYQNKFKLELLSGPILLFVGKSVLKMKIIVGQDAHSQSRISRISP